MWIVQISYKLVSMILDSLLRFLATLSATLIGVFVAFRLNRWVDEKSRKQRVLNNLKSLRKEIEINRATADGIARLVRQFQNGNINEKADHYVVEMYIAEAWVSGLQEQMQAEISSSTFSDLQELYSKIKSANEYARRTRTEALHPSLGEMEGVGGYEYEIWTMGIHYWDHSEEEVKLLALGPLLKHEASEIQVKSRKILTELDSEIDTLQEEIDRSLVSTWLRDLRSIKQSILKS